MYSFSDYLEEKLIIVGHGRPYGNVIFLAGGAASGKGFAKNFIEAEKFKTLDVDELKLAFIKIANIKNQYEELKHLDLRKPSDVFYLHSWVEQRGLGDKFIHNIFGSAKSPDRLPNLLFDVTMKSVKKLDEYVPYLLALGYKSININVIWILANYHIAVKANAARSRVVPDDILLATHEGAAVTMSKIVNGSLVPHGVDGTIKVVLNDRDSTEIEFGTDTHGHKIVKYVKDFTYITVKEPGRPVNKASDIQKKVLDWVRMNAPKTDQTAHLWDD